MHDRNCHVLVGLHASISNPNIKIQLTPNRQYLQYKVLFYVILYLGWHHPVWLRPHPCGCIRFKATGLFQRNFIHITMIALSGTHTGKYNAVHSLELLGQPSQHTVLSCWVNQVIMQYIYICQTANQNQGMDNSEGVREYICDYFLKQMKNRTFRTKHAFC